MWGGSGECCTVGSPDFAKLRHTSHESARMLPVPAGIRKPQTWKICKSLLKGKRPPPPRFQPYALLFWIVFAFFSRDFRGSEETENPCFLVGFPCVFSEARKGRLGKKTARFNVRANFVLTKDRKRPYYGHWCGEKTHREGSCSKAAGVP